MPPLPQHVTLVEVGPRDGLQNIEEKISTENKISYIEMLGNAGCQHIEITAFVNPKLIPQLADSAEVSLKLKRKEGVRYSALVPNVKGMESALKCGMKEIAVFTAASETFNMKNIHTTVDGSIQRFREILDMARKNTVRVRGYVSTSFYCPFEGKIEPEKVLEVTGKLFDLGVSEVSLGDTIGMAVPTEVEELLEKVLKRFSRSQIALHLHDTRGTGLVNAIKGLEMGVGVFDTSTGGIGGCPFAPGASGNLATEDLVFTLERMGVWTGIDLQKLVHASQFMEGILGHPLPSKYLQASKIHG